MAKDKRARISRIVLRLRDKEISLTPEEAKELKEILAEMFGKETVVHEHVYPWWPWHYPYYGSTWTATIATSGQSNVTNTGSIVYLTANAAT